MHAIHLVRFASHLVVAVGAVALVACSATPGGDELIGETGESASALRRPSAAEIVGDITFGQSLTVSYSETPIYRAFKLAGKQGDKVDLWVRSPSGGDARVWFIRESGKTLAQNDNADATTLDAHVTLDLPRTESYFVIVRDQNFEENTFTVSLGGGGGSGAAIPASRIGTSVTLDATCNFLIEWGTFQSRTSTCPDYGYGWYDPARFTVRFGGTAASPTLTVSSFSMEKEVASWGEKRTIGWPEVSIPLDAATGAGATGVSYNQTPMSGPGAWCVGMLKGRVGHSATVSGDKLTFEMNENLQTNTCCGSHARRATCTATLP